MIESCGTVHYVFIAFHSIRFSPFVAQPLAFLVLETIILRHFSTYKKAFVGLFKTIVFKDQIVLSNKGNLHDELQGSFHVV